MSLGNARKAIVGVDDAAEAAKAAKAARAAEAAKAASDAKAVKAKALKDVVRTRSAKNVPGTEPVTPPPEPTPAGDTDIYDDLRGSTFPDRDFVRADEKLREATNRVYTTERMDTSLADEMFAGGAESREVRLPVEGEPDDRRYAVSRKREALKRTLGTKGYDSNPETWATEGWRRPFYGAARIAAEGGVQIARGQVRNRARARAVVDSRRDMDFLERMTATNKIEPKVMPPGRELFANLYKNPGPDNHKMSKRWGPAHSRDEFLPHLTNLAYKGNITGEGAVPYVRQGGSMFAPSGEADPVRVAAAIKEYKLDLIRDQEKIDKLQETIGKPTFFGNDRLDDRAKYAQIEVLKDSIERGQAVLDQLNRVERVTIPRSAVDPRVSPPEKSRFRGPNQVEDEDIGESRGG